MGRLSNGQWCMLIMGPGSNILEKGRATWDDKATRLKLKRAWVGHIVAPRTEPHLSADQPIQQPTASTLFQRCTGLFSDHAQPGDRDCAAYNKGLCVNNASHLTDLHVCSFCLHGHSAQRDSVTTVNIIVGANAWQKTRKWMV